MHTIKFYYLIDINLHTILVRKKVCTATAILDCSTTGYLALVKNYAETTTLNRNLITKVILLVPAPL